MHSPRVNNILAGMHNMRAIAIPGLWNRVLQSILLLAGRGQIRYVIDVEEAWQLWPHPLSVSQNVFFMYRHYWVQSEVSAVRKLESPLFRSFICTQTIEKSIRARSCVRYNVRVRYSERPLRQSWLYLSTTEWKSRTAKVAILNQLDIFFCTLYRPSGLK